MGGWFGNVGEIGRGACVMLVGGGLAGLEQITNRSGFAAKSVLLRLITDVMVDIL